MEKFIDEKKFILAGRLFDGAGNKVLENQIIEVSGGTISNVINFDRSQDINIDIDLSRCTVLPGLIDSHVHLSFDHYKGSILAQQARPLIERAATSVPILKKRLQAGITTIRIPGERDWMSISLKKLILQGILQGPEIVDAGLAMRASAGHGVVAYPVDGVDAIIKQLRENVAAGADFVKLFFTGSATNATDPNQCYYSDNEIKAAIEEAHRLGKMVTAHATGGKGVDAGIEFGLDIVEHGSLLTSEQIKKIANKKVMLVLTAGCYFNEDAIKSAYPSEFLQKIKIIRETTAKMMIRARNEGVMLALGADDSGPKMAVPGEMEEVVKLGFTPMEAITMATKNAAHVCGLSQTHGTIESGKVADIIAVDGDPLKDISDIHKVSFVMKKGVIVRAPFFEQ